MTEAVPAPAQKPAAPPAAQKPKTPLPVALVVALVGAGLFVVGSFLDYYDIPDSTGKMFDTMAGKAGLCLVLVAVLLVVAKKMQMIAAISASLALGAVLAAVINVAAGDDSVINLVNALAGAEVAKAGIGMYAALFGAAIVLLAVFMVSKKKPAKK